MGFRWRRASDCSFGTEFSSEGIRGSNSSLFSFSSPVFIHSNLSVINVSRSWGTGTILCIAMQTTVFMKARFRWRRASEFQLVPLELSVPLKEFVDLKKTIKMSFSIDPSNPDESIQKTDKDMNNKKIVNLANPVDNEDAANKK